MKKYLNIILPLSLILISVLILLVFTGKRQEEEKQEKIQQIEDMAKEVGMLKYKKAVLLYSLQDSIIIDTDVIDSLYNAECKLK